MYNLVCVYTSYFLLSGIRIVHLRDTDPLLQLVNGDSLAQITRNCVFFRELLPDFDSCCYQKVSVKDIMYHMYYVGLCEAASIHFRFGQFEAQ